MSELAGTLGGLAEKEGSGLLKSGWEHISNWVYSQEGQLNRMSIGKPVVSLLRDQYEPAVKQELQKFLENVKAKPKGVTPDIIREGVSAIKSGVRKQVFGEKSELLTAVVRQAEKERGIVYANSVADNFSVYFGESSQKIADWRSRAINPKKLSGEGEDAVYEAKRVPIRPVGKYDPVSSTESKFRNGLSWTMTGRIAIPHLTQVINPIIDSGLKATAKAFGEMIGKGKDEALQQVLNSGALADEMYQELMRTYTDKGLFEKMYSATRHPGFDYIRKQEITLSALAAKHSVLDAVQKAVRGSEKDASITLRSFGLNPDSIKMNNWALTEADKLTAMYRGAQKDMFIRSPLDTPGAWENNWATRNVVMFKHYMFNEGRFLKETFKREWEKGPVDFAKTVGTFALIAPVFGEMVTSLDALATGHDPAERTGVGSRIGQKYGGDMGGMAGEYIDAISRIAGFGLFYNVWRTAQRRTIDTFLFGPTWNTIADLGNDILGGNFYQTGRDISRRIPIIGPAISTTIFPPKKRGSQ